MKLWQNMQGCRGVGYLRQNIGRVMVCYIIWSGCPCDGMGGPVDFWSCLRQPFGARNNNMSCIREKCGVTCGRSRVLVIMNSILES
jgi:hypothetical protein